MTADYTRATTPLFGTGAPILSISPTERTHPRAVSDGDRSLLIILPAYLNASLSYEADEGETCCERGHSDMDRIMMLGNQTRERRLGMGWLGDLRATKIVKGVDSRGCKRVTEGGTG